MQPIGPQYGNFPAGTNIGTAFNPAAAHGIQPPPKPAVPPKVPGLMGRSPSGYGGVNPQRMLGANGPSR